MAIHCSFWVAVAMCLENRVQGNFDKNTSNILMSILLNTRRLRKLLETGSYVISKQ